ncbi:MAG: DUF1836 domain-containing protein [Ruthenibacterium sp.]
MEQKIPDIFCSLCEYHCPRYEELPHIALYKDQVVSVLNEAVGPFYPQGETPVTATMVNNYVKMKLLSPPEKKKYSTEQIACLYVIFVLKQVLSISEIAALLRMQQRKYEAPYAYGRFCEELEAALRAAFTAQSTGAADTVPSPPEAELLRAAVRSFAYKVYAVKALELLSAGKEAEKSVDANAPEA